MPAQVEQQIRLLSGSGPFLAQQFIEYLQRATLATI
jgi:hypothetical protein